MKVSTKYPPCLDNVFKGATKLFSWLKDCKPDRTGGIRHLPYDASKAEKHAKFCFDNIERAAQHLNHEKMKADQQQEVRERHQRALEKVSNPNPLVC